MTFDDEVEVLVSSQPVRNPQLFISAINTIHSGSTTALFDGWLAGAMQVALFSYVSFIQLLVGTESQLRELKTLLVLALHL